VTEFGCCTYRGAGARGGTGWMIVDRLDLASYGVVKLGEDGVSWEPKEVFRALASAYA
jgi:hypothetical protein